MREAVRVSGDSPVLIDRYLNDAIEVDVDCIADGDTVYVAGVMEHIEEAGIHSGDSACSLPPYTLSPASITELKAQTEAMAQALGVVGLMNVQYAIKDDAIYVLEVNPRASRTVPFVAKATGVPIAKIGARVMAGARSPTSSSMTTPSPARRGEGGGVPLRPLPGRGHDPGAGDEIHRRGDGPGRELRARLRQGAARRRGEAAGAGTVFLVGARRRQGGLRCDGAPADRDGLRHRGHPRHRRAHREAGLPVRVVNKVLEGRPHCVDAIRSGEIQLVVNTASGAQSLADSFDIRRSALTHGVPHYTTIAGARAAVHAIAALKAGTLEVAPLQSYFRGSF